jgi:hypothetical protein
VTGETAQHVIDALAPSITVIVTWALTHWKLDQMDTKRELAKRFRRRLDRRLEPWDGVKERRKSHRDAWTLRA